MAPPRANKGGASNEGASEVRDLADSGIEPFQFRGPHHPKAKKTVSWSEKGEF